MVVETIRERSFTVTKEKDQITVVMSSVNPEKFPTHVHVYLWAQPLVLLAMVLGFENAVTGVIAYVFMRAIVRSGQTWTAFKYPDFR